MNPNASPYTPGMIAARNDKENISPNGSESPTRNPSKDGRIPLRTLSPQGGQKPSMVFAKPPPLKPNADEARTPCRQQISGGASDKRGSRSTSKKVQLSPGSPELEGDARRVEQRNKQVGYGYNTDGYRNMLRLVKSDPILTKGCVIPLAPPPSEAKASKRTWDMLIRKWRRMLHMFDNVYIEEDSNDGITMEQVQHAQRLRWVSPMHLQFDSTTSVATIPPLKTPTLEDMLALRNSPSVPTRMPIEESLQHLLRNPDNYEPVSSVIPDSLLYHTKGAQFSPTDIGIKVVVAPSSVPSQYATARSPSPEAPDFAPQALPTSAPCPSPKRCASPGKSTAHSPTRRLDTLPNDFPSPAAPRTTPQYSNRRYRAVVRDAAPGDSSACSPSPHMTQPTATGMFPFPQYWSPRMSSPTPPVATPTKKGSPLSATAPHFTPNVLKHTLTPSAHPSPSQPNGPSVSPEPSRGDLGGGEVLFPGASDPVVVSNAE